MFVLIALLFLGLPLLELYVIFQVGASIGWLDTIGLLLVISLVGAWLVRREGIGVLTKVQRRLADGELPTKELVDGALIVFAGALMLTPGFVTDAVGLLLLVPPTRIAVRSLVIRRYRGRLQVMTVSGPGGRRGAAGFGFRPPYTDVPSTERDVVDLTRHEVNDDSPPTPPPALDS